MADLVSTEQSGSAQTGGVVGGQSPGAMAVLEAMLRARGLLPAAPRVGVPGVNGEMPMRAGSVMLPPVVAPRVVGGARG